MGSLLISSLLLTISLCRSVLHVTKQNETLFDNCGRDGVILLCRSKGVWNSNRRWFIADLRCTKFKSRNELGFLSCSTPRVYDGHKNSLNHGNLSGYSGNFRVYADSDWFDQLPTELFEDKEGMEPNERDKLIQFCDKAMDLSKKHETTEEICKAIGIDPGTKITWNMLVLLSRVMLNKPAPPSGFLKSLMHELGIFSLLDWFLERLRGERRDVNSGCTFGLKLKGLNIDESNLLSETALRGFLGIPYFEHLQNMSKINPEMARKILTVIHKIYRRPILISDLNPNRFITDAEILNDTGSLIKAQSESYANFVKQYPNLKWPITDEDMLKLYSLWFDDIPDKFDSDCSLGSIMKETYGPGADVEYPSVFFRFMLVPAMSGIVGFILGDPLRRTCIKIIDRFFGARGYEFSRNYLTNMNCGVLITLGTWLGISKSMGLFNGDMFQQALKSVIEESEFRGLDMERVSEQTRRILEAATSGHIPLAKVSESLERFVIIATLKVFRKIMALSDAGEGIETWNKLTKELGHVASVCLPLAGVSVYRILYRVVCELASSEDLPISAGGEVLGSDISGEKEDEHDDYTQFYIEGDRSLGLPFPDTERNERIALLFSMFSCQSFSNIKRFKRITEPFAASPKDDGDSVKSLGMSDAESMSFRTAPVMPSTLEDIEDMAQKLEAGGGILKRITLTRSYGIDTVDDLFGETLEEKEHREQIELQEHRDRISDVLEPLGMSLEILKSLSFALNVKEDWLLERIPKFVTLEAVKLIKAEMEKERAEIDEKLENFGISKSKFRSIKWDALNLLSRDLKTHDNTKEAKFLKTLNKDSEKIVDDEKFIKLKKCAELSNLSENDVLEVFQLSNFAELQRELFGLDLSRITLELLNDLKVRYRCNDLVLINALCEAIKKFASETKKELLLSRKLLNWFQIEKHMESLLRVRRVVSEAVEKVVTPSLWYRVERAFQHNRPYVEKQFTNDEVLGKGPILSKLAGDWELVDPPPQLPDMELAKRKWEEETNIAPLEIVGVDTETTMQEQMELDKLIKEGKIHKSFECIPNEFNVGQQEEDPEFRIDEPNIKDPHELQRAIITTGDSYACWVAYCCRKRTVDPMDLESIKLIFPSLERLVLKTDRDWRRLHVRQLLRQKQRVLKEIEWTLELKCDIKEAQTVCGIAYEEELLKLTGAFVDHIEDDIGDVGDSYFHPFDISIYNRLNYLYSYKLPDENTLEKLKEMQQFLKLEKSQIETIHTKAFSFAMDQYIGKVICENHDKPWKEILNKIIMPKRLELEISEESIELLINKGIHDRVKPQILSLVDDCSIGEDFLNRCRQVLYILEKFGIFKRVKGKIWLPFTIRAESEAKCEEIIGTFILSQLDVHKKVDVAKLDELCAIFGVLGEKKNKVLRKLGRKFYFKFLNDHFGLQVNLESLKELENMHNVYLFQEHDLKELIRTYREIKIREGYDPTCGLEGLKRVLSIIDAGESLGKYIKFDSERRIHWFINVLKDVIEINNANIGHISNNFKKPNYGMEDILKLEELGRDLKDSNRDTIISDTKVLDTIKRAKNVLELSKEEFEEGCEIFAQENAPQLLKETLENLDAGNRIAATRQLAKFLKTMAMVPDSRLAQVAKAFEKLDQSTLDKIHKLFSGAAPSKDVLEHGKRLLCNLFPLYSPITT